MQIIQIARGILSTRLAAEALNNGELFLDSTNKGKSYELYVGTPDGKKKIGAEGILSYIEEITALPANPIEGGVYFVKQDINTVEAAHAVTGVDYPEFKAGDFAIYSSRYASNGGWLRINNNNGGPALDVGFDNGNTNISSTNVQQALVELDREKLAYGGVLFGKENATISTVADSTFALADIFSNLKAGYYYSIGAIGSADKLKIITGEGEDDYLLLEEGDFLSVTSDVTTNATALTAADVTLTKIAGGTHDANKIWLIAGTRNENAGSTWDTEDAAVKSVQDAVNVLYKSKADLTANGKIPLAELPDTVIGSIEYQGTYDGGTGESFVLPTAENKGYYVAGGSSEAGTTLTKGDYWIYTGGQVNLTTAGLTNVQSSEGYLNTNDWLIYNGEVGGVAQWAVIDNTSPITGISAGDTTLSQNLTLTGNIKFQGKDRTVGEASVAETTVVANATNGTITVDAPNAALIPTQAAVGQIYKEGGDKSLVATGLSEVGDKLTITEKNGIVLTGAKNGEEADIGSINIKQNQNQINDEGETSINITMPQASGTLARLEDMNNTINGSHFFLPRFSKPEGSDVASIVDSPIEIVKHSTDESSNNIKPEGFIYHVNKTLTNGVALADHDVRFRHSTTKVVHMMPAYSGYILNSNSIIDCGEWSASGMTSLIGKYDAYGNIVDKAEYADSLVEGWDSLEAVVNGNAPATEGGQNTESEPTPPAGE